MEIYFEKNIFLVTFQVGAFGLESTINDFWFVNARDDDCKWRLEQGKRLALVRVKGGRLLRSVNAILRSGYEISTKVWHMH